MKEEIKMYLERAEKFKKNAQFLRTVTMT